MSISMEKFDDEQWAEALEAVRQAYEALAKIFEQLREAIIAAGIDPNVDGVVFIAGPVTVTSPAQELAEMHPLEADVVLKGYWHRLFSLGAWGRLFTGKTSYGEIFKAVKFKLKDKLSPRSSNQGSVNVNAGGCATAGRG